MAAPGLAPAESLILSATSMLDIVERALHASRSEWLFLRELRVGTRLRNGNLQRLDAFALNSLPQRICYEGKTSRADFLCELRHPLKRRIGLRYSNEFYFVTPGRWSMLVKFHGVPADRGRQCDARRMEANVPSSIRFLLLRSWNPSLLHGCGPGAVA
jgi:hypothetical protein